MKTVCFPRASTAQPVTVAEQKKTEVITCQCSVQPGPLTLSFLADEVSSNMKLLFLLLPCHPLPFRPERSPFVMQQTKRTNGCSARVKSANPAHREIHEDHSRKMEGGSRGTI